MASTASAPPGARALEPYRLLFPLGVVFAVLGAGVWPLHASGLIAYPAALHAALMIQGFQHSFVLGFFLTAMPSFTHGPRCHPIELALAFTLALSFGILTLVGCVRGAEIAYSCSILLLIAAAARRIVASRRAPPEEFVFVMLGFVLGLLGGISMAARDVVLDASRTSLRLVSLGLVLSLVLGFGGLLVPTFTLMREPLAVPGIARAHERGPRRILYAPLALALALAFVLEALGRAALGAWLRALAATAIVLLVWKLWRLPGRRDAVSFALWSAGWLVVAGLWGAALLPAWTVAALHVTMLGGFGFLTLGISTRVSASHGGHGLDRERRILGPVVWAPAALALIARLLAEAPAWRAVLLTTSAVLWMIAWIAWMAGALPAILARARPRLIPVPGARAPGP